MSKSFINHLPELRDAGVIDEHTANRIRAYYTENEHVASERQKAVLSILGAVLIALGFILVVSYNWDALSDQVRMSIIFGMLALAQLFCGFTLWKKSDSMLWKESAAAMLFLVVGATIPLISGLYHLSGSTHDFLLLWLLIGVPIVFIMNSSATAILSIGLIIVYFANMGYYSTGLERYYPWMFLLFIAVYGYYQLSRTQVAVFIRILHWFIPATVLIMLASFISEPQELIVISYAAVCSIFYFIPFNKPFHAGGKLDNPYKVVGLVGSTGLLLILSFNSAWGNVSLSALLQPLPLLKTMLLFSVAIFLGMRYRHIENRLADPFVYTFVVVPFAVILQIISPTLSFLWINLFLVFLAWKLIYDGAKSMDFAILNYGLLVVVIQIISRFFDGNFSSLTRGMVFIVLGITFIGVNIYFLKRKKQEQ